MSILITGGAGFIGSHLAATLVSRTDAPIICLDNFNDYYDPRLKRSNAQRMGRLSNVDVIEGDFCDYAFTESLFASHRFEHVIHLGGYAGVRASLECPAVYEQNNVGGTLSLLESARKYPVSRFVLVSSSTVYGKGAAVPFVEDAPLGVPASPYGATKRAAELLGSTYHALYSVPVVCIRPFSVYGPGLRPDLALSIFTAAIDQGSELPLFGDGSIRRDFTHVADICEGIVRCLTADGIVGQAINLGHSTPIAITELIGLIEVAMQRKAKLRRLATRPEDLPVTRASLVKAKQLIGYAPQVGIAEGIREFCDWYRQRDRET